MKNKWLSDGVQHLSCTMINYCQEQKAEKVRYFGCGSLVTSISNFCQLSLQCLYTALTPDQHTATLLKTRNLNNFHRSSHPCNKINKENLNFTSCNSLRSWSRGVPLYTLAPNNFQRSSSSLFVRGQNPSWPEKNIFKKGHSRGLLKFYFSEVCGSCMYCSGSRPFLKTYKNNY